MMSPFCCRAANIMTVSLIWRQQTRFLHLIVHAAYDHQFNNGPITFYDIAVLLETAPIHWTKFWQMAATGGWTRGCVMIFELASHYHGTEAWRDSY